MSLIAPWLLPSLEWFDRRIYSYCARRIGQMGGWSADGDGPPEWLTEDGRGAAFHRYLCGWNGHGKVGWYNPNGMEPDMCCERCGEDLG